MFLRRIQFSEKIWPKQFRLEAYLASYSQYFPIYCYIESHEDRALSSFLTLHEFEFFPPEHSLVV